MNNMNLYDEIAINFPPIWPEDHDWVNIHDGENLKIDVINNLINKNIATQEVYIIVHSNPGIAKKIPMENAIEVISKYILDAEIQVTDLNFKSFVSILNNGVATSM